MKPDFRLSRRSAMLSGAALLGFLVLWGRLFTLQVVSHDYYAGVAEENRIQMAVDIAKRGLVRDRNGRILAQNEPSYSVYLMRSKAPHTSSVLRNLAGILHCDLTELSTRLAESKVPPASRAPQAAQVLSRKSRREDVNVDMGRASLGCERSAAGRPGPRGDRRMWLLHDSVRPNCNVIMSSPWDISR